MLGNGLEVSAAGPGCMVFSHACGTPADRKEAVSMIRSAYEMGYALFDTAEVYGIPDATPVEFLLKNMEKIGHGGLRMNYRAKNVEQK